MQQDITSIIRLEGITFRYAQETILKDISLSIHKGEYIGIVGPNGGGKSTLLKVILGILKPQKGVIGLFNKDIKDFGDWHKIGYIPQKNYVEMSFPVTVMEVVRMGRFSKIGLFKLPSRTDEEKTLKALRQVGMEDYKHKLMWQLSGGQQQRVLIARALASEPEVIVLDEPTAGVDIKTQKQFYTLLRELNKKLGITLILVSHELDVLSHECSKLGYINRSLVFYGQPRVFLQGKYFHELIGKGGLHYTDV